MRIFGTRILVTAFSFIFHVLILTREIVKSYFQGTYS